MATYLVTGAAGFIGYHVAKQLLERGEHVVGLDNMNAYYSVALKEARLAQLSPHDRFRFERVELGDRSSVERVFATYQPRVVVHLAAQAGVRYSLTHPHVYAESNLVGFLNVLEECRQREVAHLVYASSSSVYGANTTTPFSEHDVVDHPISLYAATKKANELMAHTYSHLYRLPTTGLRFFTVYGPWGRPDMAYYLFARAILAGEPIDVFNDGNMFRDFTYVDDIAEGVLRVADQIPQPDPAWTGNKPDPATSNAPCRIYNIGNNRPERLDRFIDVLEQCLGVRAVRRSRPMQPGDVLATAADIQALQAAVGFTPSTAIEEGLSRFVAWYKDYHATPRQAPGTP